MMKILAYEVKVLKNIVFPMNKNSIKIRKRFKTQMMKDIILNYSILR